MARLIVQAGARAGFQLGPFASIGRHETNILQLDDEIVSKHHCVVEQLGPGYVVRDVGSTNGTAVNGVRLDGVRPLAHGDEIVVGTTHLRYEEAAAPARHETQPTVTAARAAVVTLPPSRAASGVEVLEAERQIGAQIPTLSRGYLPFEEIQDNPPLLRVNYEELRMMAELTREVAAERVLARLLDKVLASLFRFVKADRGVILLLGADGQLQVAAARRRDGSSMPIRVSSTILAHVLRERASVLTPDAVQEFIAGQPLDFGRSVALNRITSAVIVPLMHEGELHGALWLDAELTAQFGTGDLELVTGVANEAAMFIANNLLTAKIARESRTRERLSRLLSPNVAEQVIQGQVEVKQGGVYVPSCTVFNSDIRGFTRMAEGTRPEIIVDMLNEYFELMVEVVFRYEGTLDKFMGDGLMTLWGVPVAHPDDPARAVACALEMMQVLAGFNQARAARGVPPFEIGIGIHTGPLVAGYVGSSRALSYTVIGDTANTSARLCSVAAPGQIIVAEATAAQLGGRFPLEELPAAHLKGKERPVRIFNVKR